MIFQKVRQQSMNTKRNVSITVSFLVITGIVLGSLFSCTQNDDIVVLSECPTSAVFNPDIIYGTLTDQEGNVYKTIQIGAQTWMAENLRSTIYRNGDPIPEVNDSLTWGNLKSGAYCNYKNTESTDTVCTYGRLYNWFVVSDDRHIAPEGWHVPTLEEWLVLESYLDDSVYTNKLKESGPLHWKINNNATNETGFTALPGGCRWYIQGASGFSLMGTEGFWWTKSEDEDNLDNAFHLTIGFNYSFFGGCYCTKHNGNSIRCVKD